jgi:hypothetical protein
MIAGASASGFHADVLVEAHGYQSVQNRQLEEELRTQRLQPAARRPERRPGVGSELASR